MNKGEWVKSSKSNGTGGNNCVEVFAPTGGRGVVLRNSRRPVGARLRFTADEWAAFVDGVKAGEFDL